MELRKATADEWPAISRLHATVYNGSRTDFSVTEADHEEVGNTWCVIDDGEPISVLTVHQFRMVFHGSIVSMAGVGGVGTLPEHRHAGHVRRLLAAAFAEMHERRQGFSLLYPFSFPYYRMFGYELVYSRREYRAPANALVATDRTGRIEQVTDATADLRGCYERFARGRTLSMIRSDRQWSDAVKDNPWRDRVYTWVRRDEHDHVTAWVTVRAETAGPHAIRAIVDDLAFDSGASLRELLAFMPTLVPRAVEVVLHLPSDLPLELMVREPYEISASRRGSVMGRITDLVPAFERARLPGEGSLVIEVADDLLDWNAGVYALDWGDGGVSCAPTTRSPDLSVDIRVLTQLLLGYQDGGLALDLGLLRSRLERRELASVFPARPLFQNDAF
ncbi:MAG: GNAT family N-acetyltransferase [Spirochaetota bacterium]